MVKPKKKPPANPTLWPPLTQQEVRHLDSTPDMHYPLRILQVYRANCDCRFQAVPPNPLWDRMNEDQEKRAKLLDKAIAVLQADVLNELGV